MNASSDLPTDTTMVVGASHGLGYGIANAFAATGSPVIAVARTHPGPVFAGIEPVVADAATPTAAGSLLDRYRPRTLVLVAGARPLMRPLQQQTWESFSVNWHSDVRITFQWVREALLEPLPAGSKVIVVSSGAALQGSPLSGGYAGAKATQRYIVDYARDEAQRAGLGISFTAVLPQITPLTDLGRPAVQAYAARAGQSEDDYVRQFGKPLTPETAGTALVELANTSPVAAAYRLTGQGLQVLS
jgi:NAD(P)-dependent dehydrogenase (short-subunit alcohol dehydrogenase family)